CELTPRCGGDVHADAAAGDSWLDLDAQALDAELLGELARAGADAGAELVRLEDDRLAALRENLALEPLVASDRDIADRAAADELPRSALDLVAGYLRRVENPRGARAPQPRRLEAFPRIELLAQELRASHPVEPEGALAVA